MKRRNGRGAKGTQGDGYVKNGQGQEQPAPVPTAQQAGESQSRWGWIEAPVWTERMLAALETGVKGGKWFRLIDKVYDARHLQTAWKQVSRNEGAAGVDHQTVEKFGQKLETNLTGLSEQLRKGEYKPQEVRRAWIPKPGSQERRPLGIPTVRDRVVQAALRNVLEPIFEQEFAEHSYGFRPRRGCKDALRRVEQLLKQGYTWIADADLKSYFDSIPHEGLMERVRERVADGRVLELLEAFLKAKIMEDLNSREPESGTPQGAVISPLLANVYLDPLDQKKVQEGIERVRYADDFVILCQSEAQAQQALEKVKKWTAENGLKLHPEKTRIVDINAKGGFDFLGYHFERSWKIPRKKSLEKIKAAIRAKTSRLNGRSLTANIENVNRMLCGWFGYFKHSTRSTLKKVDCFVRQRLRRILRRRRGRSRGRVQGLDRIRYPNAYFAGLGLYSLEAEHIRACQPSRRQTINWRAGCGKPASPVRRGGER